MIDTVNKQLDYELATPELIVNKVQVRVNYHHIQIESEHINLYFYQVKMTYAKTNLQWNFCT